MSADDPKRTLGRGRPGRRSSPVEAFRKPGYGAPDRPFRCRGPIGLLSIRSFRRLRIERSCSLDSLLGNIRIAPQGRPAACDNLVPVRAVIALNNREPTRVPLMSGSGRRRRIPPSRDFALAVWRCFAACSCLWERRWPLTQAQPVPMGQACTKA
jgi:hypothetical protein